MRVTYLRVALALAFAVAGWSIGRAQTAAPAVEIQINAIDSGRMDVVCVRGCGIEGMPQQAATPYIFRCGGDSATRCSVAIQDGRIAVRSTPFGK
jgi:hypothetical protein